MPPFSVPFFNMGASESSSRAMRQNEVDTSYRYFQSTPEPPMKPPKPPVTSKAPASVNNDRDVKATVPDPSFKMPQELPIPNLTNSIGLTCVVHVKGNLGCQDEKKAKETSFYHRYVFQVNNATMRINHTAIHTAIIAILRNKTNYAPPGKLLIEKPYTEDKEQYIGLSQINDKDICICLGGQDETIIWNMVCDILEKSRQVTEKFSYGEITISLHQK